MSGTYEHETRVLGEVKSVEALHARRGLLSHAIKQLPLPNGERKISSSRLGLFVLCDTFDVFRLENREE
jgi:hypothetical protein